jgi:hypothetical protein
MFILANGFDVAFLCLVNNATTVIQSTQPPTSFSTPYWFAMLVILGFTLDAIQKVI